MSSPEGYCVVEYWAPKKEDRAFKRGKRSSEEEKCTVEEKEW